MHPSLITGLVPGSSYSFHFRPPSKVHSAIPSILQSHRLQLSVIFGIKPTPLSHRFFVLVLSYAAVCCLSTVFLKKFYLTHGAAAAHGADLVVRVCADNPLIWGGEIDNLIRFYQREHTAGNCDYAYNHIPRNNLYPDGLGAEIVSFELFTKAMNEATLPAHREHCLSYIVDNPELFAIRTFDPLDPALHHPEMKLDMDTADDFINLALRDIRPDITPREIVELFR